MAGIKKSNDKRNEIMASIKNFNKKQQTGLDYICVCCCTVRFKKGVQELTKELEAEIRKEEGEKKAISGSKT